MDKWFVGKNVRTPREPNNAPCIDWLGLRQPEFGRTYPDWRFMCRRGAKKHPAASDYGRYKNETPLLAILALRGQGHGLKQIVKRTGTDICTISTICRDFDLRPQKLIFVSNEPKTLEGMDRLGRLHWGFEEIKQHTVLERWHNSIWSRPKAFLSDEGIKARQREQSAAYMKRRYWQTKHLPERKIKAAARSQLMRIARQARRFQKSKRTIEYLGCTYEEATKHIESQFELGMTWENYGTFWEIDHIVPLCTIDVMNPKQLAKVCHFTNLRPLPIHENRSRPKVRRIRWRDLVS